MAQCAARSKHQHDPNGAFDYDTKWENGGHTCPAIHRRHVGDAQDADWRLWASRVGLRWSRAAQLSLLATLRGWMWDFCQSLIGLPSLRDFTKDLLKAISLYSDQGRAYMLISKLYSNMWYCLPIHSATLAIAGSRHLMIPSSGPYHESESIIIVYVIQKPMALLKDHWIANRIRPLTRHWLRSKTTE